MLPRLAICSVLLMLAVTVSALAQPPAKPDVASLVQGNNAFALALYNQVRGGSGNLFFSPYSISNALAMTYAGARGATAAEMARALHFTLPVDRFHPAFRELIMELNGHGLPREYQLVVSNALWGQRGDFLPDFLQLVKTYYGSGIKQADFRIDPEGARLNINRWVASQTADKIKDLLAKGDVTRDARLILTNTIYFKGSWLQQFEPMATRPADFFVTPSDTVSVPLMHRVGHYPYADAGSFQALALPYEGEEVQMLVLLPKRKDGLAELEQSLTTEKLADTVAQLKDAEVAVALPKFKLTARMDLQPALSDLGMPIAFTEQADFSGMNGRRDLAITKVVHQAYVDVDESGTEAAAATAVVISRTSIQPTPPITFRADHPFVFAIRDVRTGSLLFVGRLANPKT